MLLKDSNAGKIDLLGVGEPRTGSRKEGKFVKRIGWNEEGSI